MNRLISIDKMRFEGVIIIVNELSSKRFASIIKAILMSKGGIMKLSKLFITAGFLAIGILWMIPIISRQAAADDIRSDICGDVNGDYSINVLDITFLIGYLYMGGPAPGNLAMCDVNNSGGINILDVTYLIDFIYDGGPEPTCPPTGISGYLADYSGCKEFVKTDGADTIPPTQDCIAYHYDGQGTLTLNHINAGFNCCPDSLNATFDLQNGLITIQQIEYGGVCDCNCLFDLTYVINLLPPGDYTIMVNEPYRHPEDPELIFEVDLNTADSGLYCVPRSYYPWWE